MLSAACKQIIRDGEKFPKPREIRDVARDLAERIAAKRALANPLAPDDFGATTRNEAILLLGSLHYEVAARLKAPSEEYKNFLAEAANAWCRVRPEGGLAETDAKHSGRRIYGFAMEAWARKHLGLPPLHPAYVCANVAEVYSQISGQPIETMRSEDDTLQPVDAGPWAKWTQARSAAE
jgi:hypothetical protein